jgi:hypothetical protein
MNSSIFHPGISSIAHTGICERVPHQILNSYLSRNAKLLALVLKSLYIVIKINESGILGSSYLQKRQTPQEKTSLYQVNKLTRVYFKLLNEIVVFFIKILTQVIFLLGWFYDSWLLKIVELTELHKIHECLLVNELNVNLLLLCVL